MSYIKRYQGKNICTLEEFKEIVKSSKSLNEIREKLILRGYDNHSLSAVLKRIESDNVDIKHLVGKSWRKDSFDESILRKGNYVHSSRLSQILIKKRGHCCECCKSTKWLDRDIPLEVHHIDGNKLNNDESNLVLLCPNCHSLTDNFRGRNMNSNSNHISEEIFAESLKNNKNIRQALLELGLSPKGDNYRRAYDIATKYNIKHLLEH